MARYSWTCTACNSWNPIYREHCSRCGCPADATERERERYRVAFASGLGANPGNNEPHIPIEEMCPQCGHKNSQFEPSCQNCRREFWCRWQPEWYENPLTACSIGRSKKARTAGKAFAATFIAFFIYSAIVYWLAGSNEDEWMRLFFLGVAVLYGAYEVWAFTHGHRTSIDHFTHEAIPSNTSVRVLGLLLDVLFTFGATYLILT